VKKKQRRGTPAAGTRVEGVGVKEGALAWAGERGAEAAAAYSKVTVSGCTFKAGKVVCPEAARRTVGSLAMIEQDIYAMLSICIYVYIKSVIVGVCAGHHDSLFNFIKINIKLSHSLIFVHQIQTISTEEVCSNIQNFSGLERPES
jgi:hypothetical protein